MFVFKKRFNLYIWTKRLNRVQIHHKYDITSVKNEEARKMSKATFAYCGRKSSSFLTLS
jgi:hypothetical protein